MENHTVKISWGKELFFNTILLTMFRSRSSMVWSLQTTVSFIVYNWHLVLASVPTEWYQFSSSTLTSFSILSSYYRSKDNLNWCQNIHQNSEWSKLSSHSFAHTACHQFLLHSGCRPLLWRNIGVRVSTKVFCTPSPFLVRTCPTYNSNVIDNCVCLFGIGFRLVIICSTE